MLSSKFIVAWAFLLSGLILTIAAILVPAMDELEALKTKHATITQSRDQMLVQKDAYENFLGQIKADDPVIQNRINDMQFNISPQGVPVVIDTAASSTPLQWIERKVSQTQNLQISQKNESCLSILSHGTRRLWLAGFGITILFLGIVLTPSEY